MSEPTDPRIEAVIELIRPKSAMAFLVTAEEVERSAVAILAAADAVDPKRADERRNYGTGTIGARSALADLKAAMNTIPIPSPAYSSEATPTAADACAQILKMIEFGIRQLDTFIMGSIRNESAGVFPTNPDVKAVCEAAWGEGE